MQPQADTLVSGFIDMYGGDTYRLSAFRPPDLAAALLGLSRLFCHPGLFMEHAARRLINDGLIGDMDRRDVVMIAWVAGCYGKAPLDLMDAFAREGLLRLQEVVLLGEARRMTASWHSMNG